MKTTCILAAIAVITVAMSVSAAPFTGTYTQDFNSMSTGTTLPDGWSGYTIAGSHDMFTPSDDPVNTGVLPTGPAIKDGTAITTVVAATPSNQKSSSLYNWAIGGSSTQRALGTSPSGTAGMVLQLVLTNNLSNPISLVDVAYDIRLLSTTTNNNNYNNPPYVGKEELPGYWLFYSLDNGVTYTNVSALNPDGHTWANSIGTVHESQAGLALSSTWNPGANLYLRWFDDNAQGPSPDQLIGLDNISITATPEPITMVLLSVGALGLLKRKRM